MKYSQYTSLMKNAAAQPTTEVRDTTKQIAIVKDYRKKQDEKTKSNFVESKKPVEAPKSNRNLYTNIGIGAGAGALVGGATYGALGMNANLKKDKLMRALIALGVGGAAGGAAGYYGDSIQSGAKAGYGKAKGLFGKQSAVVKNTTTDPFNNPVNEVDTEQDTMHHQNEGDGGTPRPVSDEEKAQKSAPSYNEQNRRDRVSRRNMYTNIGIGAGAGALVGGATYGALGMNKNLKKNKLMRALIALGVGGAAGGAAGYYGDRIQLGAKAGYGKAKAGYGKAKGMFGGK